MARARQLNLFPSYRFLVSIFDRAGALLQSNVSVAALKSLPGGILKVMAAHEVGREALVVPFAVGASVELWIFSDDPRQPDTYTGRRLAVSYESVEPLPIDVDAGESGVALDAVALKGASYDAFEDVPQDQWPEWIPTAWRSPPRAAPPAE